MNIYIPAWVVLVLALVSTILLASRARAVYKLDAHTLGQRHRWLFIIGALIIRLYAVGVYALFVLVPIDIETRSTLGRLVVVLWLSYEVITGVVKWSMDKGAEKERSDVER